MTSTIAAMPGLKPRMDRARKAALAAGIFYLITFVSSIPAVFLIAPVLNDPNYITGAGADSQVILGCMLDIVNAATAIGSAVALFSLLRRHSAGLALGFVASRLMEGVIVMIGVVSLLAVVTLRQAGAADGSDGTLVTIGHALVAMRNWTFLLGPSLVPGINALLLGTILYRSRLVPRIIPLLGLIGAPLIIVSVITTVFGVNSGLSIFSNLATAPIFLWELSLGLWMTFKGFRSTPLTDEFNASNTISR
jgi:hypothetical protein